MPNWADGDSNACPDCGVDMEVIGPPGPRHREGCSWNPEPLKVEDPRARQQEEEWLDSLFRPVSNELNRYFADVLVKHHGADLIYMDEFEEEF